MPGTIAQSEIMQPTGDGHHHVPDTILPVADLVFHDPTAFDTTDRMLDPHFLARNATVCFFLCWCEFPAARLFRRLLDRHHRDCKSLKSHVLIEHTPSGQYIVFVINNGFLMPFPSMRRAQKLNRTLVIDEQNIFDRMTFLLSTVIFCLFIRVYGSLDGTFGAIMIKKGGVSAGGASAAVTSVARRAGNASRRCNAVCNTGRKSWSHLFASDCPIPKS